RVRLVTPDAFPMLLRPLHVLALRLEVLELMAVRADRLPFRGLGLPSMRIVAELTRDPAVQRVVVDVVHRSDGRARGRLEGSAVRVTLLAAHCRRRLHVPWRDREGVTRQARLRADGRRLVERLVLVTRRTDLLARLGRVRGRPVTGEAIEVLQPAVSTVPLRLGDQAPLGRPLLVTGLADSCRLTPMLGHAGRLDERLPQELEPRAERRRVARL